MVKPTYEEKSYESAFNVELARGVPGSPFRHFSPGARLEATLGFDFMAALEDRHPAWRGMGLEHRLGVPVRHRASSQIPDGTFNLFIQYKRSHLLQSARAKHYHHFRGPYYRFHFGRPSQQLDTLHTLARSAGRNAHVVYAAPTFHTVEELWDATVKSEVVGMSVVVEAAQLSLEHTAFNFKTGFPSLQNPDPEFVDVPSADEWFADLRGEVTSVRESVGIAQEAVERVPGWRRRWERNRDDLLGREPFSESPALDETFQQFAEVTAFAWAHGVTWRLSAPAM